MIKVSKLEAMRKYANGLRLKAINSLGGECQVNGCGEKQAFSLRVVLINKEVKKLKQLAAYRFIITCANKADIAMLVCDRCYGNIRNDNAWAKRMRLPRPLTEANGEYHWIAGQRVLRYKGFDDTPEHLLK